MTITSPRVVPSIVARAFVPTLAVFGVAVIAMARWSKLAVIAVVVVAVIVSLIAERAAPYVPAWNHSRGDSARDIAHGVVNETSTLVGVLAVPYIVRAVPQVASWPAGLPFAVQVLLAVVVLDFGISFAHWQSHRRALLWRFHAVHHSVKRMYGFNGLVKHPVHQAIEIFAGMLPLIVVGLPGDVGVALLGLVVLQLLLQHSNVDVAIGRHIGRWWALSPGHRLHHLSRVPDGDVNFALFLLVWDRLFGTFAEPASISVGDGDLGVADQPSYPSGYFAQLGEPFSRR